MSHDGPSYTVEKHEHGLVVRGPIPVSEIGSLRVRASRSGWNFLGPGIGVALTEPGGPQVFMVLVSPASGEAWRQELREAARQAHADPIMAWLHGPDMGTSSLVIVATLGTPEQRHIARQRLEPFESRTHPRDPVDIGRCLTLLELVPGWTERLDEVGALSTAWARLIEVWPELTVFYEEERESGRAPRTYKLMQEVLP